MFVILAPQPNSKVSGVLQKLKLDFFFFYPYVLSEPAQGLMVQFRLTCHLITLPKKCADSLLPGWLQGFGFLFGCFLLFSFSSPPFLLYKFWFASVGWNNSIACSPFYTSEGQLIINYLAIYFWRFHQDIVYLSPAIGINRNVWPGEVPCPALGCLSFMLICLWLLHAEMYSCPNLFLILALILSALCQLVTH